MRLIKKANYIIIPVTIFLVITGYSCMFTSKTIKDAHVKCYYMAYACGDCTPQYQIREVYSPKELGEELLGKEISIKFNTTQEEADFENKVSKCSICYWYEFKGEIIKSGEKITLKVNQFTVELKSQNCCDTTTVGQ